MKPFAPVAAAAALLLTAVSAHALDGVAALRAQDSIATRVDFANKAVVNGSDENVYGSGQALQASLDGGFVVFRPSLHQVERAEVKGEAATTESMLEEGKRQLDAAGARAGRGLRDDFALQQSLTSQGRVGFDRALSDDEMGVFRFQQGHADQGTIALNTNLSELGRLVGQAFAAATLFHEAGHAGDAAIDSEGVIDGEITAFQLQYAWLKLVDPTGEKLALLRVALETQLRHAPGKLTQMALDYARTLDVLRGTGGDPANIRRFAAQLGYREGQGKTAAPLPGQ